VRSSVKSALSWLRASARAHAVVRAAAEADVMVGPARDVEPLRSLERGLVAVCGRVEQDDLLALRHRDLRAYAETPTR
jgi:hypothetical protein